MSGFNFLLEVNLVKLSSFTIVILEFIVNLVKNFHVLKKIEQVDPLFIFLFFNSFHKFWTQIGYVITGMFKEFQHSVLFFFILLKGTQGKL